MEIHHVPGDAERYVAALAAEIATAPDEDACVLCSTASLLRRFGCDGSLRWVRRYRDLLCPRATTLERRLQARGGFCDCEVFVNAWCLRRDLLVGDAAGRRRWPDVLPRCAGVGRGSARPCAHWEPRRRW